MNNFLNKLIVIQLFLGGREFTRPTVYNLAGANAMVNFIHLIIIRTIRTI